MELFQKYLGLNTCGKKSSFIFRFKIMFSFGISYLHVCTFILFCSMLCLNIYLFNIFDNNIIGSYKIYICVVNWKSDFILNITPDKIYRILFRDKILYALAVQYLWRKNVSIYWFKYLKRLFQLIFSFQN